MAAPLSINTTVSESLNWDGGAGNLDGTRLIELAGFTGDQMVLINGQAGLDSIMFCNIRNVQVIGLATSALDTGWDIGEAGVEITGQRFNVLEACTSVNAPRAVRYRAARKWLFNNCYFDAKGTVGPNICIAVETVSGKFTGDLVIANTDLDPLEGSGQGLYISATHAFSGGAEINGIIVAPGSSFYRAAETLRINAGNASLVGNVQIGPGVNIDGPTGGRVNVTATGGSTIERIKINGIYFTSANDTERCFDFFNSGGTIKAVQIGGCTMNNFAAGSAFTGVTGLTLNGNLWMECSDSIAHVTLTTCDGVTINDQFIETDTGLGAPYAIKFASDCTNIVAIGNTATGSACTSGVVQDLTGSIKKSIHSNVASTTANFVITEAGAGSIGGDTIWTSGNDGTGSGMDADLLDGQHGSYYRDASNINAGTMADARLPTTMSGKTLSGVGTAVTGLSDPVASSDAATRGWVLSVVVAQQPKDACARATTANITLSGIQTIDGVTGLAGQRTLVKNQTAPAENGIWVEAAGAWARATDADTWGEVVGATTFLTGGTTQSGSQWVCNVASGGTIGTTAITFVQTSQGQIYVPGTGILLTGNAFGIDTATTVDKSTAQTLTNKTLTTPTINGAAMSGTITGTPNFTGPPTVSGNAILTSATGQPLDADLTAIAALGSTGFAVRSAANTWVQRQIADGNGIVVTNGNGVSGNPSVAISSTVDAGITLAYGAAQKASNLSDLASASAARSNLKVDIASAITGNVKLYGAVGDGSTDDTAAINATLAAQSGTTCYLYFPKGRYKTTGITQIANQNVVVLGDGMGISSIELYSTSAHCIDITQNSILLKSMVRDISIFVSGGVSTGDAIHIVRPVVSSSIDKGPVIENVEIRGLDPASDAWARGVYIKEGWLATIRTVEYRGKDTLFNGDAVHLAGASTDVTVDDLRAIYCDKTVNLPTAGEGLIVTNTKGVAVNWGVYAADGGGLPGGQVSNCHFNAVYGGVYVNNRTQWQVNNNLLYKWTASTQNWRGIMFENSAAFAQAYGNLMVGFSSTTTGADIGIYCYNNAIGNKLSDNGFYDLDTGTDWNSTSYGYEDGSYYIGTVTTGSANNSPITFSVRSAIGHGFGDTQLPQARVHAAINADVPTYSPIRVSNIASGSNLTRVVPIEFEGANTSGVVRLVGLMQARPTSTDYDNSALDWQTRVSGTLGTKMSLVGANLGVGTTAPVSLITSSKTANAAEGGVIAIQNVGAGVGTSVGLYLAPNDGGGNDLQRAASIRSRQTTSGNYADLGFFTANSTTPVEAMTISADQNIGFGGSSFGSGTLVLFLANCLSAPSTNPSGGGVIYCQGGALKYRGSSGTVTTLGPA